ncbi:hypothetical protein EG68_03350 [Paragonimus skrjabini miyazakii]|uniref:Uncharacterized protein n=1 Tax=Paragonimus skrjabini miyazakii TaxID=59628 RepID=A0A8S9Z1B6_9TREM|nr:hypothetical protein EG68_03350 [Paragonimus skrjabini miyazakii]
MELRIPPRLESRSTDEFMPVRQAPRDSIQQGTQKQEVKEPGVKTSILPYHIARHRKMANSCFVHARSKEHGLKHIDLRKGVLAIFWIIVFLFVMSILFTMITDLTQGYIAMPVATQIKAEQEEMQFPDISICTKVPFYTEIDPDKNNKSMDRLLRQIRESVVKKLKDASIKITEAGVQGALLIQMATRQDDTFLRAYQHLIYCQYDDKACSFYNFTEIAHLRYVQCFTFSPNRRKLSGGRGLQFIFYRKRDNKKPFLMLNDLEDAAFTNPTNDGIHIFVHNPSTFPTYAINNMPTSFSLRFGQHATVEVSGLRYQSDRSGRKSCARDKSPYKYTNFRGGANYLEYKYTYEDCIANMKQNHIFHKCRCYSDNLFVPFDGADHKWKESETNPNLAYTEFCRDIRKKTSQRLREEFLCYDQYENMPTTLVLDQFVPMDRLYWTQKDLDARKIERHKVCSLLCQKNIYSTRFFDIVDLDPSTTFPPSLLDTYVNQLVHSQLKHPYIQEMWNEVNKNPEPFTHMTELKAEDLIVVDIRMAVEHIDIWEEELTESFFNFISNLGGTLGLCAGISFLSSFFLLIFFGRAFFHAFMSLIFWFWWTVYLGKPPATPLDMVSSMVRLNKSQLGDYSRQYKQSSPTSSLSSSADSYSDMIWTLTDTKDQTQVESNLLPQKFDGSDSNSSSASSTPTPNGVRTSADGKEEGGFDQQSEMLPNLSVIRKTQAELESREPNSTQSTSYPSFYEQGHGQKSVGARHPSRHQSLKIYRNDGKEGAVNETGIVHSPTVITPKLSDEEPINNKRTENAWVEANALLDVTSPRNLVSVSTSMRTDDGLLDGRQLQLHQPNPVYAPDKPVLTNGRQASPARVQKDRPAHVKFPQLPDVTQTTHMNQHPPVWRAPYPQQYCGPSFGTQAISAEGSPYVIYTSNKPPYGSKLWNREEPTYTLTPAINTPMDRTLYNPSVEPTPIGWTMNDNPAVQSPIPVAKPFDPPGQTWPTTNNTDSDGLPPYFYDPPPPPLVRRPINGPGSQQIYAPEENNLVLYPLVDQELVPRYLRERYT